MTADTSLLAQLEYLNEQQLPRLLVEHITPQNASRKARRVPRACGKILLLTKDQNHFRVVNDDGSLGLALDWDDLSPMHEWPRASKPAG